jgi:RNA polymerase sigma-70 factor (ECF subfamily)
MVPISAEDISLAEAACARARRRWQGIGGSPSSLIAHVERLGTRCGDLERFGDELHLACMCLRSDPVALRVLEADYVARIPSSLARLGTERDFTEEVSQLLRQRLLVLPEPRLATYAATGPLLAWLRVVAMRIALSLRRSAAPVGSELRAEDIIQAPCPEACDAPRYREAIESAIRRGFERLSLIERNLLRLHYLDGLSLDRLAGLYGAHRATIARRLSDLKRRLLAEVEKDVRAQLKLSRSEFRSVLGLIRSHLDASLGALLGAAELAP